MTDETIFAAALEKADPGRPGAIPDRSLARRHGARKRLEAPGGARRRGRLPRTTGGRQARPDARETRTVDHEDGAAADEDESLAFQAPPARPDSLGRIGHYEVLQVLGKGGFGIVFRAFDDVLQRRGRGQGAGPADWPPPSPARKRFLREARSSAPGSARERRADLRGRRTAAAVPGDGVHPRRDAPAATRPHRPARTCPRCCGSAGRSPRDWPPPTRAT